MYAQVMEFLIGFRSDQLTNLNPNKLQHFLFS